MAATPTKQHFKRNVVIAVLVIMIILIGIIAGFTSGFFIARIDGSTSTSTPTPTPTQTPEQNQPVSADNNTALSAVSNGLQLSITLTADKTTYEVGEEVEITFAVTNVSNQTLNFINQNGDSNFNFQVYNSTHNAVYTWELGGIPLDNWNITLAPNQSYTRNLIWGQQTFPSPYLPKISSGAYFIIGELGYANTYAGYVYTYPIQTTPPNFQTAPLNITIGEVQTPTANPARTPTIPELSLPLILPLLLSTFSVAVIARHRKTVNPNKVKKI